MKKERPIVVKQPEINPVPLEVMAESIKAISEGVRKLHQTRLNESALILLIQHACPKAGGGYNAQKPGYREVQAVLEGLASLERKYLKPTK